MAPLITRRQFIGRTASLASGLAALPLLASCTQTRQVRAVRASSPPKLLVDALRSDDMIVQADAARLLGDLGSREAVPPLLDYVRTDRRYVKTAGLDALARIGDPAARPRIKSLIEHPNVFDDSFWYGRVSVQVAAALALLALGDDSGADFLLDDSAGTNKDWALFTWFGPTVMRLPDTLDKARQLKQSLTVDKLFPPAKTDPGQIVVICDALGLLGSEEACGKLVGLLDHMSRYVRARAATNLMNASADSDSVERVRRLAEQDPTLFTRVRASQALTVNGLARHARPVAAAVRSALDQFDRAAAIESLGIIGDAQYVPLIAQHLGAPDPYVRLCAVEALDRIATPAAVSTVTSRRGDSSLRVRLHVEKCLAAHA